MSESPQDDPDDGGCVVVPLSQNHVHESGLRCTGVLIVGGTSEQRKEMVRRLLSPLSADIHNPAKRSETE